jgi:mannosyl-3-phosphoglycerate phosphatase
MLQKNENANDAAATAEQRVRTVVFTDLDGTLLDHHSYSFDAAAEMLGYLRKHRIPLVIVTSKTRPEVLKLQERLGICEAFIVENGAGAFIPSGSLLSDPSAGEACEPVSEAKSYRDVRAFFEGVKAEFALRGFGDMDVAEVMRLTGLEEAGARDAMRRDFTEPFVAEDRTVIPALREKALEAGLDVIEGGRFFHLVTHGATKGRALRALAQRYASCYGERVRTIALGDSANDVAMLEVADKAVLIPHPDGSYEAMEIGGLIRAPFAGPKGWNAALKELLDVCEG